MSVRAGKAYVEFFVEDKEMRKKIMAVEDRMRKLGDMMTAVGADMMKVGGLMVAPLVAATKSFATYGATLDDMSQRAGVSVETISELSWAIEQSGGSAEGLDKSFKAMANSLVDAQSGLAASKDAYDRLGLSVDDLLKMTPEKRFLAIADAISKLGNEAEQAAISQDIFGREGYTLLPILRQGSSEINRLTKQARDLGLVMSTEDAVAAAALDDKMNELNKQFKMITVDIGAQLMPTFMAWAQEVQKLIPDLRTWIQENQAIIVGILKLGTGLVALGGGMVVLGKLISTLGSLASVSMATGIPIKQLFLTLSAAPYAAMAAGIAVVAHSVYKIANATNEANENFIKGFETVRDIRTAYLEAGNEMRKYLDNYLELKKLEAKPSKTQEELGKILRLREELQSVFGDLKDENLSETIQLDVLKTDIAAATDALNKLKYAFASAGSQQEKSQISADILKYENHLRRQNELLGKQQTIVDKLRATDKNKLMIEKAVTAAMKKQQEAQEKITKQKIEQIKSTNELIRKTMQEGMTLEDYSNDFKRLFELQQRSVGGQQLSPRELGEAQRLIERLSTFGDFGGSVDVENRKIEFDAQLLGAMMQLVNTTDALNKNRSQLSELEQARKGLDPLSPGFNVANANLSLAIEDLNEKIKAIQKAGTQTQEIVDALKGAREVNISNDQKSQELLDKIIGTLEREGEKSRTVYAQYGVVPN